MLARKALAGTAGAPKVYVEDVMSSYLYTGTGANLTITNNIDLSTEGGLVWIKNRSLQDSGNTRAHWLFDSARTAGYSLSTNSTSAESNVFSGSIPFSTTGFSINTSDANLNGTGSSAYTYVSWTFRKAKKFFDVVTYTGNGSARTISHNLGSTPGCIIVKRTDTTGDWYVYHRSNTAAPETDYLLLNSTAATADLDTVWNDTAPTSTVFSVGTNSGVNANSGTYVAYLFAHDAGGFGDAGSDSIIKCGSTTTDGSGNATVTLDWEPQWLLLKPSSTTGNWLMVDTMRGWNVNATGNIQRLRANLSDAEDLGGQLNPTATGFKTSQSGALAASTTYIYIAIRRGPMKTPTSGTSVFTPVAYTGNGTARTTVTDIVTDLSIIKKRNTTYAPSLEDRLRGANQVLESNSTGAEIATSQYILGFDVQNGVRIGTDVGVNESSSTFINWAFRRAPGFFDAVCWTGTGSATTFSHNLGVTPELIIVKCRSSGSTWRVYSAPVGNTKSLALNSNDTPSTGSWFWNNTSPTASVFSVGTDADVNGSGSTYVAYLFASVSGVSKVGSYTGNGSSVTVTTDFQPRFIMVKRTDSTGNWIVSDSARGLVSGSDPYLLLNSNAAEDTDEDWVDVSSTGFTVNETSAANANVNTGTYIYLAIA